MNNILDASIKWLLWNIKLTEAIRKINLFITSCSIWVYSRMRSAATMFVSMSDKWRRKVPRHSVTCRSSYNHLHIKHIEPKQNGRHFADDMLKCIFLNENVWIPNNISLKFVPEGPINNNPALVQVMAGHRPGDKPLPKPRMVRSPTHICVNELTKWHDMIVNPWAKFPNSLCRIDVLGAHREIVLMWMPQSLINEEPTLIRLMAWCRQQQAITCANGDLNMCRDMALHCTNVLKWKS